MHNCAECDGPCYCHGDIDDCPVETPEYAYEHCTGCGCEEENQEPCMMCGEWPESCVCQEVLGP